MKRDAHRLAPVLEDEDVADELPGAQLQVPVLPDAGEVVDPFERHRGQRVLVPGGVDDHLADTLRRFHRRKRHRGNGGLGGVGLERWELVLEDHDVIGRVRHLGRETAGPGGAERTIVRRRQERPVLAVGRGDHPLFEERMPAQLGHLSPLPAHEGPQVSPGFPGRATARALVAWAYRGSCSR